MSPAAPENVLPTTQRPPYGRASSGKVNMREDIESRDPRSNGPATSPMGSVEDLVAASSRAEPRARAGDGHEVRERHFHWPETERTHAAWVDWEWRAWGVGQRAKAAVRRAWQSLTTHDHADGGASDHGDHPMHATPAPIDELRGPRP